MNFEDSILRQQVSSRGGGVEICLSEFGFDGKMTAYQNYLGGGLLSSIGNSCNIPNWRKDEKLVEIAENLSRYYHELTNPDTEWEGATFEELQRRPLSAF